AVREKAGASPPPGGRRGEHAAHPPAGRQPPPLQRRLRDTEEPGGFTLRYPLIPDQLEDLALVRGQRPDALVELAPDRQPARLVGRVRLLQDRRRARRVVALRETGLAGAPALPAARPPG